MQRGKTFVLATSLLIGCSGTNWKHTKPHETVHVPLDDVPVEVRVRAQRALEVHRRAGRELRERRARERLAHRLEAQRPPAGARHGEAGAAHRDRIPDARLGRERRRAHDEAQQLAQRLDGLHRPDRLDDPGEHRRQPPKRRSIWRSISSRTVS